LHADDDSGRLIAAYIMLTQLNTLVVPAAGTVDPAHPAQAGTRRRLPEAMASQSKEFCDQFSFDRGHTDFAFNQNEALLRLETKRRERAGLAVSCAERRPKGILSREHHIVIRDSKGRDMRVRSGGKHPEPGAGPTNR
jgi:hypothetical protein